MKSFKIFPESKECESRRRKNGHEKQRQQQHSNNERIIRANGSLDCIANGLKEFPNAVCVCICIVDKSECMKSNRT